MKSDQQNISRRRWVAGAATAGALAAAATAVLPVRREPSAEPAPAGPAPRQGGGYRVSEHVLRYYQTTRV